MKHAKHNLIIGLYSLLSSHRWLISIPAMMVIAWFTVLPVGYAYTVYAYRFLLWCGTPPAGNYAPLVMSAGVIAFAWLSIAMRILVSLLDYLQHIIYRAYVNSVMLKYYSND